ncbi:MAG: Bug family tripartite tricarboxylate transporter substrate binding protein [Hyphomicrobiaceae bacterium]
MQSVAGLSTLTVVLSVAPVAAQGNFPDKPITNIVGFPAGGGTDLIARGVQPGFEKAIGVPMIVKNVPGASSSIATTEVASAAPDGYTVHMISNAFVIQPYRLKVTYDVTKFEPICLMTASPMLVVTTKTSKFKTMADVVAAAKAEPGKIPYGSPGAGTAHQMSMAIVDKALDLKLKHVPFKGANEVAQALLSGTLDLAAVHPQIIEQFDLVPLAAIGATRAAGYDKVPTVKEATGTEAISSLWIGLIAPPGTPKSIIDKLAASCKTALTSKETIEHFTKQQQPVSYLGPADFGKLITGEYERARQVMESAGLKQN